MKISYTVKCTISNPDKIEEWLAWLSPGHIDELIAGGAESAEIVKMDNDGEDGTTFEIRYVFPSRAIFNFYIENHAPRLREDGLKRFPPEDGFSYARSIGEIQE